jgi:hypothetical protein
MLLLNAPALAQSQTIIMKAPAGITAYTDNTGARVYPDALGHVTITADQLAAYEKAGFERLHYVLMRGALSGDLVFVVSPATLTTAAASFANRTVTVTLQNAAGETHIWYNRAVATGVAIAHVNNSGSGTYTIASTTLTFVNGVATVLITEGGTPAATDTDTLTVAAETICGFTVASKTSAETFD